MINNKTVLVDIDDVTANLIDAWLMLYNQKYEDKLTRDDIVNWDISLFVKPECGKEIYKWIDTPEIYDIIEPVKNALFSVNKLRKNNNRVVFVTASTIGASGRKFRWLNDNGFDVPIRDYIEAHDKSLILGDILLDDGQHNCESTTATPYIFTQAWNKEFKFEHRVYNWNDFMEQMEQL